MPGLVGIMDVPVFTRSGSLKAHKALPRRRVLSDSGRALAPYPQNVKRQCFADNTLTNDAHSPDHNSTLRQPVPLTPPPLAGNVQDYKGAEWLLSGKGDRVNTPEHGDARINTTIRQPSLPTPDITPPRKENSAPKLSLPSSESSQQPPSRTESFTTAREQFSSDDEDESPLQLSSMTPVEQERIADSPLCRTKDIGLGLGLESDDDSRTPTVQTPSTVLEGQNQEFNTFDGSWTSNEQVVHDPFVVSEPAAVREVDIHHKAFDESQSLIVSNDVRNDYFSPSIPLGIVKSLREKIELGKNSPPMASIQRFAKETQGSLDSPSSEAEASFDMHSHRYSQMSGASTVVEVIVLSTQPRRQQTLRHSYKRDSLRDAGSSMSGSNRSSLASEDRKQKLVHKNTKITERGNRVSLNSDSGVSMGSDYVLDPPELPPVSIVPRRQSSLKYSQATRDLNFGKVGVLSQYSSRPTTAPELSKSDPIVQQRALRPMSESIESPRLRRRKPREFVPVIPARSSSLSAPTSRNVSRTASLTSTSLHTHTIDHSRQHSNVNPMPDTVRRPTFLDIGPEKVVGEEWLSLRPRSSLATPFSAASYQSSTPGALEVNEATAVSIYPHNNKSILVVQQAARKGSNATDESATLANNVGTAWQASRPMPKIHQAVELVDSPLIHPREAPQPPYLKIIPPTPASMTPNATELQIVPNRKATTSVKSSPLAKMRRALSARRYSESFVPPVARSLSGRQPPKRQASVGEDPRRKLSPFWHPRAFWDDIPDSEIDERNQAFLETYGSPRKQELGRHFGSLKARRRSESMDFGSASSSYGANGFLQSSNFSNTTAHTPQRAHSLHLPRFLGLHHRLEKMRTKMDQDRREKERLRLRNSIGPVIMPT